MEGGGGGTVFILYKKLFMSGVPPFQRIIANIGRIPPRDAGMRPL